MNHFKPTNFKIWIKLSTPPNYNNLTQKILKTWTDILTFKEMLSGVKNLSTIGKGIPIRIK